MNELSNMLRIANTAIRTIKIIEIAKKAVVAVSIAVCFCFGVKYFRKR